jgi:hypothetical protein
MQVLPNVFFVLQVLPFVSHPTIGAKTDNRNHTGHIVDENEEIAVARRD